jgi:hypothetical protein
MSLFNRYNAYDSLRAILSEFYYYEYEYEIAHSVDSNSYIIKMTPTQEWQHILNPITDEHEIIAGDKPAPPTFISISHYLIDNRDVRAIVDYINERLIPLDFDEYCVIMEGALKSVKV